MSPDLHARTMLLIPDREPFGLTTFHRVLIDVGADSLNHTIDPEEKLRATMARH